MSGSPITTAGPRSTPRGLPGRMLAAALVGAAVGAGLVLLGASRVWTSESVQRPQPLSPQQVVHTGASLAPALPALGLVALAGAGALLATRGGARRLVGGLLVAVAVGIVAVVAGTLGGGVGAGWPATCLVGALGIGAAGGLTLRDGARWPVMGARYARSSAVRRTAGRTPTGDAVPTGDAPPTPDAAAPSSVEIWDAIDRGEDPTRD